MNKAQNTPGQDIEFELKFENYTSFVVWTGQVKVTKKSYSFKSDAFMHSHILLHQNKY